MTQSEPTPGWKPTAVLACSVLAVSSGAIFARLAVDAPALIIAAYRVGLAFLVLAPFAWWKSGPELRSLSRRDVVLGVVSGLFLAAHFGTWITSLKYTSVANSVVLVNTIPLWVGLMTPLFAGERLGRAMVGSILLSVFGSILISVADFQLSWLHFWGDLLAVAGAICAACYLLIGRTLRQRRSLLAYVMLCYGSAALVLGLLVLVMGLPVVGYSRSTMAALVGMALVSQILGHTAFNWVLRWLRSGFVAVCLLGEPILATIWAYFLFGESLSTLQGIGGCLVLLGIYIAARAER
jgi:drug/metabolite transporter (DMT)-like permease